MEALVHDLLVVHCDWGTNRHKQWLAAGAVDAAGAATAGAPEPVGDPTTLLERLQRRANGSTLLVGFDFPIGVPKAYAELAGVRRFPELLRKLAADDQRRFFQVAAAPADISVDQPFYPSAPGGSQQRHLTEALGVAGMDELRRVCERRTGDRRQAAPLFWLVGAAQVGRAALSGWRDVLIPALDLDRDVKLWPFDGELASLLATRQTLIVETYPTEFYRQLGANLGPGGKTRRSGRQPACTALAAAADRLGIQLTPEARAELQRGFGEGTDGEDRFDAFVGLLGMLNVVLGRRDPGPPPTVPPDVLAVEGWILGQETHGPASAPPPALERLAALLRRRNAIDAEIAGLIGRPALPGHIGEFIAAEVFDIELERSASQAGHDGLFRSGPLAGTTVNVKCYAQREGLLDIPPTVPDYFLVLAGPPSAAASSVGRSRPLVIEDVFLFHAPSLLDRLRQRGAKIGIATSVRNEEWERARVWPTAAPNLPPIATAEGMAILERFGSGRGSAAASGAAH